MARALPEWIGKTPDTPAPPRVRLRIFEAHGGICFLSKRKIAPGEKWEMHHIVALIEGGVNAESNLAPVLADAHKTVTARQMKAKAKVAARAKSHAGIRSAPQIPSAPMPTTERAAKRAEKATSGARIPVPTRTHDIFGGRI